MMGENKRIYLSPPHLGGDELKLVTQAFESNWIAPVGPDINLFEQEICEATGAKHAVALSSGTAGIHLALKILGVGPGDEVLCSSFTFIGSVSPVVYQGATPVFVDSEPHSWNMDPEALRQALEDRLRNGGRLKAVIVVHLYGQSSDMDPIAAVCREFDVPLLEDAAESLGATYRGRQTGTLGKCGVFSFNGNKIITTSGGGAVVSDDDEFIQKVRFLATQARDPAPHYEHSVIGFNYRLSNILAALGRGQLRVLDERIRARRRNFEFYTNALGDLPGLSFMPEPAFGRGIRWLTCVTIRKEEFGCDTNAIRCALENENIETRPLWKPMHLQPVFQNYPYYGDHVAESLFRVGLCLPSGSSLSEEDMLRVVNGVRGMCLRKGD
jgi:dTDP-4-amino-4,6-dideoxygalactose transaminase